MAQVDKEGLVFADVIITSCPVLLHSLSYHLLVTEEKFPSNINLPFLNLVNIYSYLVVLQRGDKKVFSTSDKLLFCDNKKNK